MRYAARRALALTLVAGLAGCGGARLAAAGPPDWRSVATQADRERLREWRTAFVAGLEQARAGGHGADIAREGRLLDPDAAVATDRLPAGDYRCRVIKLGSKTAGGLPYVSYPAFGCRIDDEDGIASLRKLTGSQRPVGVILGSPRRWVFIGTLQLGDEKKPIDYGRDQDRDMIGAIEGLGDGRWRLILPYPAYESVMDVVELVPVAAPSS